MYSKIYFFFRLQGTIIESAIAKKESFFLKNDIFLYTDEKRLILQEKKCYQPGRQ